MLGVARSSSFRLAVIAAVACAVLAGWSVAKPGGDFAALVVADVSQLVFAGVAAALCVRTTRRLPRKAVRSRAAWAALAAGAAGWAVGQAIWSWYELVTDQAPFPSAADIGFLLFPAFAVVALFLSLPREVSSGIAGLRLTLDGLLVGCALFLLGWSAGLETVTRSGGASVLALAIATAYPVADVVVLSMIMLVVAWSRPRHWLPLVILASGLASLTVADFAFAYFTASGSYGTGSWLDTGWLAGFALVGLAAVVSLPSPEDRAGAGPTGWPAPATVPAEAGATAPAPAPSTASRATVAATTSATTSANMSATEARSAAPVQSTAQLLLPYLLLALAAGLLIGQHATGDDEIDPVEAGTALAVAVLVLARQLVTIVENRRLVVAVRTYAEQRLAAMRLVDRERDVFVSNVSHELRTPLTSMAGYVEMLADGIGGEVTEEQRHLLGIVERNGLRLRRLVEDLLTLSRVQSGTFTVRPIETTLGPTLDTVVAAAAFEVDAKHLDLVRRRDGDATRLFADPPHVERMVENLVSNAVKFSDHGGRVLVDTTTDDQDVLVRVSNAGPAVSADEQAMLFRPFYRASAARENETAGTGIGLSLVAAIAEQHGGGVQCQSEPDDQSSALTTFTVRLPRLPDGYVRS